jgi:hypothetical protein
LVVGGWTTPQAPRGGGCFGFGSGFWIWGLGLGLAAPRWRWMPRLPSRGPRPNCLGCSLDPLPFTNRKCHQMSSKEHIQLGWVVRWVLGTHPGPPHGWAGGAAVSCQYFPCSFVLALRELGLRLGVKAPLPLRASSRGVLPGAGRALAGCRTRLRADLLIKTAVSNSRPIGAMRHQIESPKRSPKNSAQRRLPQSDLPQ